MSCLEFGNFILCHFLIFGSLQNILNVLDFSFHISLLGLGNLVSYIL